MPHAELAEQLFVDTPRVLEFGRRRDDADARCLAAADLDKTVQDLRIAEFFLSAADRDDVAALAVLDYCRRDTSGVLSLLKLPKYLLLACPARARHR